MGKAEHNFKAKEYGPYDYALGDELRGERATLGKTLLDIQRDLRIKAAYIAAIEDAKPEVFPNPSFIAGYVRSYARYLSLDPDEVFHRFCKESGFVGNSGGQPKPKAAGRSMAGGFQPDFAIARVERRGLPQVSLAGVGSVLVLVGLLLGLGYGGWTVLQNIQRVQFAPVDDMPLAVAEVDAPVLPEMADIEEPALTDLASPVAATALADLYRQQELDVPILVPRDGPIAALDPDRTGLLAAKIEAVEVPAAPDGPAMLVEASATVDAPAPQVAAAPERQPLVVIAERAAWVRVYLANGTVLFERILEKGETYSPPEGTETPMIWAGNAGSVYVKVGDTLRGPLGRGTRAAKDVSLDPQSITEKFGVVEDVPEVVSQAFTAPAAGPEAAVAIQ